MKLTLAILFITLSVSRVVSARQNEEPCRTDGCVSSRQAEMELAMKFANSTVSAVTYVKSLNRQKDGLFKLVDNDNKTSYLVSVVLAGDLDPTLVGCLDAKFKKINCDDLKP
jgi:hypothetical protein